MNLLLLILCVSVSRCMCSNFMIRNNCTQPEDKEYLKQYGIESNNLLPRPGDIPLLNRKIQKAIRVTIMEHPYIVSIRRMYSHYLTGTIVGPNLIATVAHPIYNVSIDNLGVVVGQNYNDRGSTIHTVILVVIHEEFELRTLKNDLALIRVFEDILYRFAVKPIKKILDHRFSIASNRSVTGFVTGWGRCDVACEDLCLPRSSIYYPDEFSDPMLRSINFILSEKSPYCDYEDSTIHPGMLCTGPARSDDAPTPCLAVPGAPLVVNGKLLGILSWGFGCGYANDMPLIYTDARHYNQWLQYNIYRLTSISQVNYTILFDVTSAIITRNWLAESRKSRMDQSDTDFYSNLEVQTWDIDAELCLVNGDIYDIRDFIGKRGFHAEKLERYDIMRSILESTFANSSLPNTNVDDLYDGLYIPSETSQEDSDDYDYDNSFLDGTEANTENSPEEDVTVNYEMDNEYGM